MKSNPHNTTTPAATGRGGGPYLRYGPPDLPGDRGRAVRPWPDGLAFIQGGQRYKLDRLETHERHDGETVQLVVLSTHCADCGASFEVRQPLDGTKYLNRRCADHRKPGKKAGS